MPDTNRSDTNTCCDAINWFEIPSVDFDRAVRFYETLLSTKMNVLPSNKALFPASPTGVGGTIVHRADHAPAQAGALVYLNADGMLPEALLRAELAGGSVLVPITPVPGGNNGSFACIVDSEGNHIGLHAH